MSSSEQPKGGTLRSLLRSVHGDQRGGVSIETVLIIAAIALPILIFLMKVVWPRISDYVIEQLENLFGT